MDHVPVQLPPAIISEGDVVVLKDLQREELNGLFGAVVGTQNGRLVVDVANRGRMAFRPINVDFVAPTRGWCHSCAAEVTAKFNRTGELQCQRCGSSFIESSTSQDYSEAPSFSEHRRRQRQPRPANVFRFGGMVPMMFPTGMMMGQMGMNMFGAGNGVNISSLFEEDILHQLHQMNEPRGPPPASESAVAALKEEVLECDGHDQCAVCQDEQCSGDTVTTMPCGHVFHKECLTPWLTQHNTCPTCRHELPTSDAEYNQQKDLQQQPVTPQQTVGEAQK